MKKLLLLFFTFSVINGLSAQLNLTYKSDVQYDEALNDIWGHVADGREYALVGTVEGLSIIDVTDTENPVDLGFAPGPNSTWRDVKVHKEFAYVTNETGDGILVIDLRNLPTPITPDDYYYWAPDIPGFGVLGPCHNIWIDEKGVGLLSGCNLNDGGILYIDLDTNPGIPEFIAANPPSYSHDAFTRGDTLYDSQINDGVLAIYDYSDLNNIQLLATQQTPFDFTHNAWLSNDSKIVFTTDEVADAPVTSYDISDLDDIVELDQFRPISTINQGVLPHNVFVWNDWLIISYYTDGCILADASRPDNIIEVGNFDTYLPGDAGGGAWGAYPYLPSGTVLVTDMGNGLYVLEPNYVRACWLEGFVTDAANGNPLNEVSVEIASSVANFATTSFTGEYKTGLAVPGTFDVTFSKPGYFPKTVEATLENGVLVILNVELEALPSVAFTGIVIDEETGDPIPNAIVSFQGELEYNINTDANGNFNLAIVLGDYDVVAGLWGYQEAITPLEIVEAGNVTIELTRGYKDDFIIDQGWEVVSSAEAGEWIRAEPVGTTAGPVFINPDEDIPGDLGDQCYVTGNGGGDVGFDDVDGGFTRLTSPPMDLSMFDEAVLTYRTWFVNEFGFGNPDDFMEIKINNGITEVTVEFITESDPQWRPTTEIQIHDFIELTSNVTVIFETADFDPSGHVLEAGVDVFQVQGFVSDVLQQFSADITEGCLPLEVNFTDPNNNTIAWDWIFVGGAY